MRLVRKNKFVKVVYDLLINYPAPINLSYAWNFGISAGIFLVIQFITGILLAMYYVPTADLAFNSVRHIIDDVDYGLTLRTYHASGSSLFFFVVYMHLFRGLYYGSYSFPRFSLWASGVVILLLMIVTAFIGYVLPWGQMSFWAATVITNLITVIPFVGQDILLWLWGGYSIDDATLHRFFSLHYLLPFILLAAVIIHIIILHQVGSHNPLGVTSESEKIPFFPYFIVKDLFSSILLLWVFNFYAYKHKPAILDYDNYIEANPLVTPAHIVPEWYFKPFYAILRSVPNKEGGTVLLLLSIIVLLLFPLLIKPWLSSARFRPFYTFFYALFISDFYILAYIGGAPIEYPYYTLGQIATGYYFAYFLLILPGLSLWENYIFKGVYQGLNEKDVYKANFLIRMEHPRDYFENHKQALKLYNESKSNKNKKI
jgi:quinol-cytochrome oxidoreductase complex cytochrome b subunit